MQGTNSLSYFYFPVILEGNNETIFQPTIPHKLESVDEKGCIMHTDCMSEFVACGSLGYSICRCSRSLNKIRDKSN
jgi:hypothetical protein